MDNNKQTYKQQPQSKLPSQSKSYVGSKLSRIVAKKDKYNKIFEEEEKIKNVVDLIDPYIYGNQALLNYLVGDPNITKHFIDVTSNVRSGQINNTCPPIGMPLYSQPVKMPSGETLCIKPINEVKITQNPDPVPDLFKNTIENKELTGGGSKKKTLLGNILGEVFQKKKREFLNTKIGNKFSKFLDLDDFEIVRNTENEIDEKICEYIVEKFKIIYPDELSKN